MFISYRDETELMPTFKIKPTKKDEDVTLQITGVTLKMTGVYKCVATNPAGQAVCAAQINVTGMWVITGSRSLVC